MFKKKKKEEPISVDSGNDQEFIREKVEVVSKKRSSLLTRLYGVIFLCIGIIGFLNSDYLNIGTFICYIFVYAFGIFSYFAMGGMIALGIFLIFKGKWPRFRVTFTGLGWTFLFLFGTLSSSLDIDNLTIPTFLDIHNANMASISIAPMQIVGINVIPKIYGGFLGDMLASLFITGTGIIGARIFAYLFLIFGVILVLRAPFFALYLWLRNQRAKRIVLEQKRKREKEQEKIKQLSKIKESPAKHINPFEETRYEGKPKNSKTLSSVKKDQEKDVFVSSSNVISPMMAEYSSAPGNLFEHPFSKDEKSDDIHSEVKRNFEKKIDNFSTSEYAKQNSQKNVENFSDDLKRNQNISRERKPEKNVFDQDDNFVNETKSKEVKKGFFNCFSSHPKVDEPADNIMESKRLDSEDEEYLSRMNVKKKPNTSKGEFSNRPDKNYPLPSLDLLSTYAEEKKDSINEENARRKIPIINNVFRKFNIGAHVDSYTIGPSVTRFNIKRDNGVKISVFSSNNIQQEISADLRGDMSVRIEAVVKGQSTSGVEVANEAPTMVSFKECMEQIVDKSDKLLIPFGENISSEVVCASLDKLPHLLVSGSTGSGKSVFIHAIIMTLIMRNYPDELKFILIDPKQVEFTRYKDMPHLYCPIISDVNKAVATLKKLIEEMERRYTILSRCEVNKIQEYNKLKAFHPEYENLPYLVCIIDEFADLMGQDAKNVDYLTQRLTQKARAAGIYLIIATQRPSVKCITGTIKANIPARVALSLPTYTDSRTILDEGGAEVLIGKGDLLARIPTSFKSTVRLQSAFVSNEEISAVVGYLRSQSQPEFNPDFLNIEPERGGLYSNSRLLPGYDDELYEEIKKYVMTSNIASTSDLQRRFSIGYGRAAAIFDALEDEGIVVTLKPSNRKQVVKHLN